MGQHGWIERELERRPRPTAVLKRLRSDTRMGPVSGTAMSIRPTSDLHLRWTSYLGERYCQVVAGSPAAA